MTPVTIGNSTHGQEIYKRMLEARGLSVKDGPEGPGSSWAGVVGRSLQGMLAGGAHTPNAVGVAYSPQAEGAQGDVENGSEATVTAVSRGNN